MSISNRRLTKGVSSPSSHRTDLNFLRHAREAKSRLRPRWQAGIGQMANGSFFVTFGGSVRDLLALRCRPKHTCVQCAALQIGLAVLRRGDSNGHAQTSRVTRRPCGPRAEGWLLASWCFPTSGGLGRQSCLQANQYFMATVMGIAHLGDLERICFAHETRMEIGLERTSNPSRGWVPGTPRLHTDASPISSNEVLDDTRDRVRYPAARAPADCEPRPLLLLRCAA